MQTTANRTVANSLPKNEVIFLTLLISKRYIPYTDLRKDFFDLCGNGPCLYSVSVISEFQWGKGWIDNHPKNVIH